MKRTEGHRDLSKTDAIFVLIALIAGLVTGTARPAAAQGNGTVTGAVTDNRNDPLPRVSITVRNRETNAERQAITGPNGTFTIGNLPPGTYDVVVSDPGFVAFRQEVVVAAGQSVPVKIVLSYTVEDFAPVTDRWRLTFPVWQRYPPEQEGEYPFVPNRGLDPYDQSVLKGDIPIIGDNIFMILTGVAEMPFEYRKVPTPSGVSQEDAGSDEFFERVSSSRSCRPAFSRSRCSAAAPPSSRANGRSASRRSTT